MVQDSIMAKNYGVLQEHDEAEVNQVRNIVRRMNLVDLIMKHNYCKEGFHFDQNEVSCITSEHCKSILLL